MIQSKEDFIRYLHSDMQCYYTRIRKERFICWLTRDPICCIARYIRYLRKEEYYYNVRRDVLGKILRYYYARKKNSLGNKLGLKVPMNCVGAGLTIYHHGEVIINESAVIGDNCKLHGGNCIGNNGYDDRNPRIGNNFDCGIGAKVIGDIELGDDIRVGANAVVITSCKKGNTVLVGVPAREKEQRRHSGKS